MLVIFVPMKPCNMVIILIFWKKLQVVACFRKNKIAKIIIKTIIKMS